VLFAHHTEDRTPVAMNEANPESGGKR